MPSPSPVKGGVIARAHIDTEEGTENDMHTLILEPDDAGIRKNPRHAVIGSEKRLVSELGANWSS